MQVGVKFTSDFGLKTKLPKIYEDFWIFETISGSMRESLWELIKIRLRYGSQGVKKALEEKYFDQWIITDINNILKGNPYAI
jgi:hypothetical protein